MLDIIRTCFFYLKRSMCQIKVCQFNSHHLQMTEDSSSESDTALLAGLHFFRGSDANIDVCLKPNPGYSRSLKTRLSHRHQQKRPGRHYLQLFQYSVKAVVKDIFTEAYIRYDQYCFMVILVYILSCLKKRRFHGFWKVARYSYCDLQLITQKQNNKLTLCMKLWTLGGFFFLF